MGLSLAMFVGFMVMVIVTATSIKDPTTAGKKFIPVGIVGGYVIT